MILQISVSEFGILKPCAPVLGTVSKTNRIGLYRYSLNTFNFNAINANASPFQKPAAVNRQCAKCNGRKFKPHSKCYHAKRKQSFFLNPDQEILVYQMITLTNVLVVPKKHKNKYSDLLKYSYFKKTSISKSSTLTCDGFRALGQDFTMPASASFTNQLLHWLILGDSCRHSFMTSGKSHYAVLSVFYISNFIGFALITLF